MTLLTSLARALAAERGRAQPIRTVRHVHLSERPLVFVPLQLAGEANAPLAAMVGDDRDAPRLLVVYEPRDRNQRFEWAADLADIVGEYIEAYTGPEPPDGEPLPDAPQFLVPNSAGVRFCRLLGRSTRFRKTEGAAAVRANVPPFGRWLTFFAERPMVPASSLFLSMTEALTDHWATGQSATEDQNLASLLGWIDPPAGMTGAQAAELAEDPVRSPPAGPVTDPGFDNLVLAERIEAVRRAAAVLTRGDSLPRHGGAPAPHSPWPPEPPGARPIASDRIGRAEAEKSLERARVAMARALQTQLAPAWQLMWRAFDLLQALPEAAHVASRWERDRWSFTAFAAWMREDGGPQPRRDGPVSAARRLSRLESTAEQVAAQRAYDDPLVMAEYRLTGEAFAGTVTAAQPDRIDETGKRRVLRPRILVATHDEVLVEPGTELTSPARPKQVGRVTAVRPKPGGPTEVVLELRGGMGRGMVAPPGSIPEIGEAITYTTLKDEFRRPPVFPEVEFTPWTHGGPPVPPAETEEAEAAAEAWS